MRGICVYVRSLFEANLGFLLTCHKWVEWVQNLTRPNSAAVVGQGWKARNLVKEETKAAPKETKNKKLVPVDGAL